jgi:hypothetical protein
MTEPIKRKSSGSRRRRGFVTEELVAAYLAENGWPFAEAVPRGTGGPDIKGTPGIIWEVKARTGFDPMRNVRQVLANTPDGAMSDIVLRCNGQGPASIGLWPVFKTFEQEIRLLRQAGYGEPLP